MNDDIINLWYDQLGSKVPQSHRAVAAQHCRDMGMDDGAEISEFLDQVCKHIRRDEPERAMQVASERVTLSGAYRLMAALSVPPDYNDEQEREEPRMVKVP